MILKSFFKKRYKPNFLDFSAREKKKIIDQALVLACEEQIALVKKYEEKYECVRS